MREEFGIERETAETREEERYPPPRTGIVFIHARARARLILPSVTVVKVKVVEVDQLTIEKDKG